jgi:ATP-dependent RNA helicase DDX5/DBP2
MPSSAEDYVHRIGRTARAGAKGSAYSFFTLANARLAKQMVAILEEAGQAIPLQLSKFAATAAGSIPLGNSSFRPRSRGNMALGSAPPRGGQ